MFPYLKLCSRATATKQYDTGANVDIDQWTRTEEPKVNAHSCSYLVFGKGVKNIHWRKAGFFNRSCWKNKTKQAVHI